MSNPAGSPNFRLEISMNERAQKISDLAIRWGKARRISKALKKKRSEFECPSESDENIRKPCWKQYETEEIEHGPQLIEQCESCEERYKVHQKLIEANAKAGALLGALLRMVAPPVKEEVA